MVRAPSGQTPRGRSIMPRNSIKRKYRPCFEALECKQLLSAGLLTHGLQALVQATAPVSSQVEQQEQSARMAPGRESSSSRPDNLLFQLSRAGFDLFEPHLVRRTGGVELDGPAQFFDRFGVGLPTLWRPSSGGNESGSAEPGPGREG